MDCLTCPFCQLTMSFQELERHANNHFEEDELARDMELAQQISLAPPSPPQFLKNEVEIYIPFETSFEENSESSISRYGKGINRDGEKEIDEKVSCLISLQIRSEFQKVEDGLISLLRKCLESEAGNSMSLLCGPLDHFQSIELEDVGWGCGWRNIQMLSSHLLKQREEVKEVLFGGSGFVPDITSLQRWLEIAWEKGFDRVGSDHFDRKICGFMSWIGTTECATLFRSFGLRARIVDFDHKAIESSIPGLNYEAWEKKPIDGDKRKAVQVYGPMDRFVCRRNHDATQAGSSSHEECSTTHLGDGLGTSLCSRDNLAGSYEFGKLLSGKVKGHQVLIDWVWNYFSENKFTKSDGHSVFVTGRAPLYFQHDGHSRTIVGIQVKHQKNGMQQHNLLILDPAHRTAALESSLKENFGWQKLIKRGIHTLKKQQYQLCYIDPGIACAEEMEQLKTLDSALFVF
ncbi:uncharacterized protein LOC131145424 [Malania oleifera]|uniref:uncharacterized protein LOC131145424 n=1 Tax=Malania oleifera TaxID=397392 RepID=UPI0025AE2CB5|nr:uncharacterized protein LOC131145424 [Malania oleifera]XP_057950455.1 uncharacterized protein LOC131145424 [Malania oleifera]XP_057950457.1 uncharacterized protein LOC131145424 [Malania oleifera]XP_057950458.1 uncharacterized protein LOC131145424 [Malania oleifera]